MSGPPIPKPAARVVDRAATKRALLMHPECAACGEPASNGHHVLGVGRGQSGDDVVENIVGLCGTGTMRCHGAFHGNPYTDYDPGRIGSRAERRDREWVGRRVGEHLREHRSDVLAYVLGKLGDDAGRDFLQRTYHLDLEAT